MSGIINALFGHHQKNKDEKKHSSNNETTAVSSSTGSSIEHTAISEDVRVQSTVSTECKTNVTMQNFKKINDLMNKLGTTHHQIDEYSKKRNAEISEAVAASIEKVVSDTAEQQQDLLADANRRSAAIDEEYKQRLQAKIAELDNEKAILLVELERTLNERQEAILQHAKLNIDALENAANEQKMAVLKEAQYRAKEEIHEITDEVAELAAQDAQRRLQSTTQTIIRTNAVASHSHEHRHSSNDTKL